MILAAFLSAAAKERGLPDGFRAQRWAGQEVQLSDVYGDTSIALGTCRSLLKPLAEAADRERVLRACAALRQDVFLTVKGTGLTSALLSDLGHDVVCVDKDTGKIEGVMYRTLMVDLRNVYRSQEARGVGFDYVGIGKP